MDRSEERCGCEDIRSLSQAEYRHTLLLLWRASRFETSTREEPWYPASRRPWCRAWSSYEAGNTGCGDPRIPRGIATCCCWSSSLLSNRPVEAIGPRLSSKPHMDGLTDLSRRQCKTLLLRRHQRTLGLVIDGKGLARKQEPGTVSSRFHASVPRADLSTPMSCDFVPLFAMMSGVKFEMVLLC